MVRKEKTSERSDNRGSCSGEGEQTMCGESVISQQSTATVSLQVQPCM